MDPLNRVAGKSFAKTRIRAPFPFARIEQDALHLPFVVRTPHGIARTVYLVHSVDGCTGYPTGWQLTIGAPREMDSLLCLEMYLTPAKAARFKTLGIAHEMNIYGTPTLVIFDNGPENKGGVACIAPSPMLCARHAWLRRPICVRRTGALELLQGKSGPTTYLISTVSTSLTS